jgi:hypothetical protein
MSEPRSCEFCGRETVNKCGVCRMCLDSSRHRVVEQYGRPDGPYDYEDPDDLSDDSLGPTGSDDRPY